MEEKYGKGYTVGYDSLLMNANAIDSVKSSFEKKEITLKAIE